jgi:hypothetical protein
MKRIYCHRGDIMALTKAQRKANDKYIKGKYQRLPVSYSKEFCAQVRAAAEASGETLAGYVKTAIEARMHGQSGEALVFDGDSASKIAGQLIEYSEK